MTRSVLISFLLFSSISTSGTGWVYLGFYPFLYDTESQGWSYSSTPIIWHQDIQSGDWKEIGEQPEDFLPEALTGLTITFCEKSSCWEADYHGLRFLDDEIAESWNYSAMMGGYTPEEDRLVLYSMIPTTRNHAILISVPLEEGTAEILSLEFTGESVGKFVGAISGLNLGGKRFLNDHWSGTFEITEDAPFLPGQ